MKITDTISVNPSKSTLGHVEAPAGTIFRANVIGVEGSSRSADLIKVLFPTIKGGLAEYTKYAVPLRTVFATILIVTGITLLETSVSAAFAICSLCFGAFLALGLLARPVMLGAAVFYCISGALALRAGVVDMNSFSLMFGCLIFGIIGSGKYSCDQLLLSALRRSNRVSKSRKDIGYKAFHAVKY